MSDSPSSTASVPRAGSITGEVVEYQAGGATLRGYLVQNESVSGPRPGVLVVHEWWGHNEYARRRARMLAELGYTALAVDMYGDGQQAAHPEDAMRFVAAVEEKAEVGEARFDAAMQLLQAHPNVDATRIAAIGYCFGGGIIMHMARRGRSLAGVAAFHGGIEAGREPLVPGAIKGKVAIFHGEADPFVPAEAVLAFRKEMADAGVDLRFYSYPGVKHSFTNPEATALGERFGLPLVYDADADQRSWEAAVAFLDEVLGSAARKPEQPRLNPSSAAIPSEDPRELANAVIARPANRRVEDQSGQQIILNSNGM
ncbi:MAG: dienelactone hydrolase family protein [Myxococcales bacterium FL481]|nr:MAG: dienelactone hydrolase family protein [Myxococcales bacterium FL481]